jgi:esterase/lipase superfamily enzyme
MHIEYHKWFSPNLNREMELKVYGAYGQPFIIFPCSRGRFFDYENFHMIDAISGFIDGGKVKLYTLDSVDGESWYNFGILPGDRSARHDCYDRYVAAEVVPFIRDHCKGGVERVMANGTSMGAYHSLNFFLRHPDLCLGTIALSGLYRLDRAEFGMQAHDIPYVYFNSPVHYLATLEDPWYLDWYKKSVIVICVGQGPWENEAIEDTRAIDYSLRQKSVPAFIDYWGHDVNHDWPWWFKQMSYFLGKLYG